MLLFKKRTNQSENNYLCTLYIHVNIISLLYNSHVNIISRLYMYIDLYHTKNIFLKIFVVAIDRFVVCLFLVLEK